MSLGGALSLVASSLSFPKSSTAVQLLRCCTQIPIHPLAAGNINEKFLEPQIELASIYDDTQTQTILPVIVVQWDMRWVVAVAAAVAVAVDDL
jgi:hypothetical protein